MLTDSKYTLLFLIASISFMIEISAITVFGNVSDLALLTSIAVFILYLLSAFLYVALIDHAHAGQQHHKSKAAVNKRGIGEAVSIVYILSIALLLLLMLVQIRLLYSFGHSYPATYSILLSYTVNFVLFLLSITLLALSAKILASKKFKNQRSLSAIFILIAISTVLAFYASGAVSYILNDETYIGIEAFKMLLSGVNPYTQSFSAGLYAAFLNHTITGPTLTSSNGIINSLGYPFLYVLALAPFYEAHGAMHFTADRLLPLEIGIFLALLLLVLFLSLDFKQKPPIYIYSIILILPLFMLNIISPTSILLLVFLVLSLWKSGSKYVGVPIGIAASIQQLSWVPILLIAVYIFNNHGAKRGMLVLATAVLVFALINGYFLLLNPGAFIRNIFTPLSSAIIPSSSGPLGFYALLIGIPESVVSKLYPIAIAFSVLGILAFNNKKIIGTLSIIPFVFMNHSLALYYVLFVSLTIISLALKDSPNKAYKNTMPYPYSGRFKSYLYSKGLNANATLAALLILMALASAFYVVLSASAVSPPLVLGKASMHVNNSTYYTISVKAGPHNLDKVFHVFLYGIARNSSAVSIFGAYGEKILYVNGVPSLQQNYTASPLDINRNILMLRNTSEVNLSIYAGNSIAARCIFYNSTYFVICPAASVSESGG